eukprot:gnl/TRDRNA2_/TRDRNA2_188133_c0_seq1.p1 gnl/TRDRNA2_/TRDRNA2_188133_c0~~gnl/TRDRNA2_/TRDRNA2_188133_c0_seq1.p1  ORF type:complete len:467 (-),score=70.75 gnl/TRDRNA2_/TRDRNA2_188133_c0_seq1:42-1400(-)
MVHPGELSLAIYLLALVPASDASRLLRQQYASAGLHHRGVAPSEFKTSYCQPPLSGAEGKSSEAAASGLELAQVQLAFRHGERSTLHHIPKVTNNHEFSCALEPDVREVTRFWPSLFDVVDSKGKKLEDNEETLLLPKKEGNSSACEDGQLLNVGIRHLMQLGEYLQNSYDASGLLANLSPKDIFMRSTGFDRTRGSAASLMSGLLGPDLETASQRGPFHLQVNEKENMFGTACPSTDKLIANQTAEIERLLPTPSVVSAVKKLLHTSDMFTVSDDLLQSHCDGGALPCGPGGCVDAKLAERIQQDADRKWCETYSGKAGGLDAYRLKMQPLLTEMLSRFREGAAAAKPRLVLYSGHDVVIAPLAAALGVSTGADCKWPEPSSRIVMELWRPSKPEKAAGTGPMVRILFNGQAVTHKIDGCGAGDLCPLDVFAAHTAGLLGRYASFKEACKA